jgi:NAD(P)-dependent dehydrogenase (short-subunit alcohol dehydrogenase family)
MDTTRIALVTGASAGIGQACAQALIERGWHTWCVGRNAQALQATVQALPEAQRQLATVYPADVSDEGAVAALFERIKAQHGRLDLLFNNAGLNQPTATPDELDPAQWRSIVDVNLNGAFYCLHHAFALMRAQQPSGGRIINNGSISAQVPRPSSIAYAATKSAINGLTRAASLDGRRLGIAVGQIDIGNVASAMTERMAAGVLQADGEVRPEARMPIQSVVETFLTMAHLPLNANIFQVTVMANEMPFVGRG